MKKMNVYKINAAAIIDADGKEPWCGPIRSFHIAAATLLDAAAEADKKAKAETLRLFGVEWSHEVEVAV